MSLKLLIHKESKEVLYAEAGKDAIDFLFSLLLIPTGSIIKNFNIEEVLLGSIGNLHKSVAALDVSYFLSNQIKSFLLNPAVPADSPSSKMLSITPPSLSAVKKYYHCCPGYYSDNCNTLCPKCLKYMSCLLEYRGPNPQIDTAGGFVKNVVKYMVTNDLTVTPLSTISSIALLNKLNVNYASMLEERIVYLGQEQGLELFKASLQSKTVLADVFQVQKKETT